MIMPLFAGICAASIRLTDVGNLLRVLWEFLSLSLFSLGGATPCSVNTTFSR